MSKRKNKKKLEPKCKNCGLFKNGICGVAVLHEGITYNIPVEPEDNCFFENQFVAINEKGLVETFKPDVKQVRWWVEDEKGNKTDGNGVVKIEYESGFFGKEISPVSPEPLI